MQFGQLKRREFITLLGGAAAVWPLAARAQQEPAPTVRQARVGILSATAPTSAMLNAFREGMRERGYIEGQNLSIDVRWPQGTFKQNPAVAAELAGANVEVILAWSTPAVIAARRATSAIPIVMVSAGDRVGSGLIASLAPDEAPMWDAFRQGLRMKRWGDQYAFRVVRKSVKRVTHGGQRDGIGAKICSQKAFL